MAGTRYALTLASLASLAVAAAACHRTTASAPGYYGYVLAGIGRYHGTAAFDASATFTSGAIPDLVTPTLPGLGTCVLDTNGVTLDAPPGWHTLDAGPSLDLQTPIGSLTMLPDAYLDYSATAAVGAFVPEATYTLVGPGGADVRPFTAELVSPSDLVVNQPDMTGVVPVSRTSGLSVQWTSQGGSDPVEVFVGQLPVTTFTLPGVTCLFADSGSGFVPGSLFGPPFELGSAYTTTVSVEKLRIGSFYAPPFGPAQAVTVSVWNADATITP